MNSIRRSLRIWIHTVCLRISLLTRGRLDRSVFNISPKQTLLGPLELCSCKVSLVLCQITGFSLYLCQFQIRTRSPIDTSTNWPMRIGNATPQLAQQRHRHWYPMDFIFSIFYLEYPTRSPRADSIPLLMCNKRGERDKTICCKYLLSRKQTEGNRL